ncbi:MAG TPA: hypothetical protein VHW66_19070 [Stellaceae bacterium]|jgi:hypothetical protein|nr:hypothetical protein [Stellaceae bacterium]
MAARTRKQRHDEFTRERIQTTQLVNRLTGHALGRVKMTASQVVAGLGLLKKSLPDLKSVEISGPNGGPIETSVTDARQRNLALLEQIARRAAGGTDAGTAPGGDGGAEPG